MPASHLRALITELHPKRSVREISLTAGLDPNRIAYYLKPSTQIDQMPKRAALEEIARALECDLALVAEAFAADAGLPLGPPVTDPSVAALLHAYQCMAPADRAHLLRVAGGLAALTPPPKPRRGRRRGRLAAAAATGTVEVTVPVPVP